MSLAVTLLIFLILVFGILKKINLNLLLLGESLVILLYLTVTEGSVLGEATTGNVLIDCFAYIANYLATNIGGVVFSMALVSAYVEVMKKLGATDTLAYLLCRGVGKLRARALILTLVILFSTLLRTCITSGPAAVILLLATFYPVMLRSGCSVGTACAAILVPNAICWGPADPIDLAASQLMGIEVNMAEWFVRYMLPVWAVIFAVAIVVFLLIHPRFDQKHFQQAEGEDSAELTVRTPKFFALLPMLPLVVMLLFSPFLISSIQVDNNGAVVISLTLSLLVTVLFRRKEAHVTEMVSNFCTGICESYRTLGLTVLFAMLFATCLNSVGGMQTIADVLMGLQMPPLALVLLVCIFAGVINIVVGSFVGALSIAEPIAASVAAATGISAPLLCFLVVVACGAGCVCSPVNPMVMILSKKMDTMELIKRTAIPIWAGVLASAVFGVLVLG